MTEITLDNSFEDILRLEKESEKFTFSHEVGEFKELSDNEIDKLSPLTKTSYFVSFGMNRREKEVGLTKAIPGIEVWDKDYATATDQLDIEYPKGFREKFHPVWKRGDEYNKCIRDGYTPATSDDGIQSFKTDRGVGPARNITVGARGKTELILMKIPKKVFDERQRAIGEKSAQRIKPDATLAELERMGGQPFVPSAKDGRNWD